MIHFFSNQAETEAQLHAARDLVSDQSNWMKEDMQVGSSYWAKGACFAAGSPSFTMPSFFQKALFTKEVILNAAPSLRPSGF